MTATTIADHPLETGCPPSWASEWGEDRYGVFVAFRVGKVTQRMRWIPPGTFWMGSPEQEEGRWDDEGPRHLVTLTQGFWLADTPCTQDLWQEVMDENPSEYKINGRHPVENVSWEDCQQCLKTLNQLVPGLETDLPTEAQWEYACRAGTETGVWVGDLKIAENAAPQLDDIAWYWTNSGGTRTHEVAAKSPNPWGLYDMLGNVWEWCTDRDSTYSAGTVVDPTGPEGTSRVFRGGSWGSAARLVRASSRSWHRPGVRDSNVGFRLSRGQEEERGAPRAEPVRGLAAEPQEARGGTRRRLR